MRQLRTYGMRSAVALVIALAVGACGAMHPGPTLTTTVTVPASALTTTTVPASLLKGLRPIGASARFHPRVTGTPTGRCARRPGRLEAHIELFGANRVVLIGAGVGVRVKPHRCYGDVVTLDPTGTVHFRRGATLRQLFTAWGEPLSSTRMASFTGRVRYYVAGKRVKRRPRLREHEEIVLEEGPYVPPHKSYSFPKGL